MESNALLLDYKAPTVDRVVVMEPNQAEVSPDGVVNGTISLGPQSDYFIVEVVGANFGPAAIVRVASSANETNGELIDDFEPEYVSGERGHTTIRFRYQGTAGFLKVVVGARETAVQRFENVSPLVMASAAEEDGESKAGNVFSTAGNNTLVLRGTHFTTGSAQMTVEVDFCTSFEEDHPSRVSGDCRQQCAVVAVEKGKTGGDTQELDTLRCNMPPGQGKNVRITVVHGNTPSGEFFVSYAPPTVEAIAVVGSGSASPSSSRRLLAAGSDQILLPTTGGTVELQGRDFGLTPQLTLLARDPSSSAFAALSCNCSVTGASHDRLVCQVPAGQGRSVEPILVVGGQEPDEAFPAAVAFAPPVVTTLSQKLLPTVGGEVTLQGSNFGTVVPRVHVGAALADVVTASQTELRVRLPAGQGAAQSLAVDAWGQTGNISFGYIPPTVAGKPTPAVAPSSGGVDVTLSGANFGLSPFVLLECTGKCTSTDDGGPAPAPATAVSPAHDALVFTLPALRGAGWSVFVEAGGQRSAAGPTFSYLQPNVTSMDPANCTTDGGCEVTLRGVSFGGYGAQRVQLAGSPTWAEPRTVAPLPPKGDQDPHTEAHFTVPGGVGKEIALELRVAGQSGGPLPFHYNPPEIDHIRPNVPDAEGEGLDVLGRNFGPVGQSAEVLLDDAPCEGASTVVTGEYDARCSCAARPPAPQRGPRTLPCPSPSKRPSGTRRWTGW